MASMSTEGVARLKGGTAEEREKKFFENLKKGTDDAGAAGKSGKAGEAGEAGEATSSARNSELEGFKSAGVGKAARGRGKGKKKKSVTAATEETYPSRPTASSPRLSTVNCVLSPPPPPGAGSPPPPPPPPSSSSQTPWSCSLRKDTGEEFLDVLFSRVENPVKPRTKAMLVEGDTFEGTNGGTFTITKIVPANVGGGELPPGNASAPMTAQTRRASVEAGRALLNQANGDATASSNPPPPPPSSTTSTTLATLPVAKTKKPPPPPSKAYGVHDLSAREARTEAEADRRQEQEELWREEHAMAPAERRQAQMRRKKSHWAPKEASGGAWKDTLGGRAEVGIGSRVEMGSHRVRAQQVGPKYRQPGYKRGGRRGPPPLPEGPAPEEMAPLSDDGDGEEEGGGAAPPRQEGYRAHMGEKVEVLPKREDGSMRIGVVRFIGKVHFKRMGQDVMYGIALYKKEERPKNKRGEKIK